MAPASRPHASPRPGGPPAGSPDVEERPPYLIALAAAAGVFALYAFTLAPTTAFWDTSEYITTAHILGIPHPPGNPLFVVLARAWELLLAPFGLSVAVRINLFSAFVSAAAHGLWFLVAYRILSHFSTDRRFRIVGALAAVLVSATAFTVWNQSNVNEKVYTVSLFTIALLTWLAFHWRDNLGRGKDDNLLVLMVFILALSVGNHLMAFLAAPAIGIFILLVQPRALLNWRLYAAGAVVAVVGLSIHLYLPIRASLDPIINEADPTCRGVGSALVSILSWGQAGCAELSAALAREQYDKPPLVPRLAPFHSQLVNYVQYFDWQWARALRGAEPLFAGLRLPFTLLFAGLGAYGGVEHYRRDRPSWAYVVTLFATLSVALVFYLNFRYGYTIADPLGDPDAHEVRERDYFFIVSFSVWGLWAGLGIATIWRDLRDRLGSWAPAAPVLLLALLPLLLNWSWASRRGDHSARDWAYNLLMSVEPYGVLFTNGDNDTFPLWYLQEVEGIRQDVTVIVTSYLNTAWYAKQIRDLTRPCPEGLDPAANPTRIVCQRPYRPEEGARAVYTSRPDTLPPGVVPLVVAEPIVAPERGLLDLDDATLERAAGASGYSYLEEGRTVPLGPITATLTGGRYLLPWHRFGLSIVDASTDRRPVYFASSGNASVELGLERYLLRQGLAFRLHPAELEEEPPDDVVPLERSGLTSVIGRWLDAPRTERLVGEVFLHRSGLPEWDHWPDHSTLGIPQYYAWAHYALAQAALQEGDREGLERHRKAAEAWGVLGEP